MNPDHLAPDHVRLAADLLARHPGLPCRAVYVYPDEVRIDVASAADVERWAAATGATVTTRSIGSVHVTETRPLMGLLPLRISALTRAAEVTA